jgi:cytochrome c-type biogenesis protein CcmH/NrfG
MGRYQEMIDLAETILSTQGGQNVEETYLYLGHARAFLGDGPGAVEAYQQALRLNENFYPAQWALDSIVGGS